MMVRAFADGALECPLEFAQHFVLGAAAWAESLGFAPHPDFADARPVLGLWQGPPRSASAGTARRPISRARTTIWLT